MGTWELPITAVVCDVAQRLSFEDDSRAVLKLLHGDKELNESDSLIALRAVNDEIIEIGCVTSDITVMVDIERTTRHASIRLDVHSEQEDDACDDRLIVCVLVPMDDILILEHQLAGCHKA